MKNQSYLPDPSVDKRLLNNLHCARLEMEEVGLQLDNIIAKLDDKNRQQRLKRIQS